MDARDEVSHRLFFAFDLDEPTRESVQRLIGELSARIDPAKSGTKGRLKWVERENLHLTVSFLGPTPQSRLEAIRRTLEPPFVSHAFELTFDTLGLFSDRRGSVPRVVWLGDSAGAADAQLVQAELSARLEAVGLLPASRPFRAHLTLGRYRESGGRDDRRLIREFVVKPVGPLLIDHLTLYESRLSDRGPSYTELVRVLLQGSR